MSRHLFGTDLHHKLSGLTADRRNSARRSRVKRSPASSPWKRAALMANISASAVITSAPAGANNSFSINLTNSSSSTSAIGTFWYAWVPGEDFLATSPISVTPPTGWSDQITNMGPGDGYAIEFTANTSVAALAPGHSLGFSFVSADTPAAVNGNSVFFPSTPVGTSFVYPGAAFSDAGHEFVVTPPPPPPPPPSSSAAPVTVTGVHEVLNKRHMVTQIDVFFSGAVSSSEATNAAIYRLASAGKRGSFTARNSLIHKLRSAVYDAALNEVILTPKKPFALAKPVQLMVNGTGLQDSTGQFIDGANNGVAGSNALAVLTRKGVTLN